MFGERVMPGGLVLADVPMERNRGAQMMKRVSRDETEVYPLPGRDWHTYLGPQNIATERISFGVSVFPAGSKPDGHVHDT